jgi:large conductance mechanosensitive channel
LKVGEAELGWGAVLQATLQFVIIGFVLFLILKAYNTAAKKDHNYAPAPTPSEALLIEIRELMTKVEENTRK